MLLTGGWLTLRSSPSATGAAAGAGTTTVFRVVEPESGDQALVIQHADGQVEVVDELDQPRTRQQPAADDEMRTATSTSTNQREAWRPAHR